MKKETLKVFRCVNILENRLKNVMKKPLADATYVTNIKLWVVFDAWINNVYMESTACN